MLEAFTLLTVRKAQQQQQQQLPNDRNIEVDLDLSPPAQAMRALSSLCLSLLMLAPSSTADVAACLQAYYNADCMTDRFGALSALVHAADYDEMVQYGTMNGKEKEIAEALRAAREEALSDFYERFSSQALVVDRWFA